MSDDDHLAGLSDGAGCAEVWEHLSAQRAAAESSDDGDDTETEAESGDEAEAEPPDDDTADAAIAHP